MMGNGIFWVLAALFFLAGYKSQAWKLKKSGQEKEKEENGHEKE